MAVVVPMLLRLCGMLVCVCVYVWCVCNHTHHLPCLFVHYFPPSTQDGIWVGFFFNDTVFVRRIVPLSYLNCTRQMASVGQSSIPGCLVKFDRAEEQCAEGREGQSPSEV